MADVLGLGCVRTPMFVIAPLKLHLSQTCEYVLYAAPIITKAKEANKYENEVAVECSARVAQS